MMNIGSSLARRVKHADVVRTFYGLLAALLLGTTLLPSVVSQAQATASSGPSLQDTFNWLTEFLVRATGASDTRGLAITSSLQAGNGCNIAIRSRVVFSQNPDRRGWSLGYALSLSDINPDSIKAVDDTNGGFVTYVETRSTAALIRDFEDGSNKTAQVSSFEFGNFVDHSSAQRTATALKHAAQLCSSTQPF